jgi:hypothetical protein
VNKTEDLEELTRRELRSPRAAAIAGILYSILIFTVMILTKRATYVHPGDVTGEFLETWSGTFSLVLTMVPFAGIAFLWFTGVIRDRLRDREDRFFATIFFGSGIIYVLLIFLWGAILGTIMRMAALETSGVAKIFSNDILTFGLILMNEIDGNFALRMAGVYMSAVGTLWNRTKLMPRWLTLTTYILAAGFLVAAERIREARFIFPTWVLVVSVYVLILNYRRSHDLGAEDGMTVEA